MNYSKPEVNTIGQAVIMIERTGAKPGPSNLDGSKTIVPAYDLDE
jgi:hypothetical protein